MKFLEMKKLEPPENKMLPGTRQDQGGADASIKRRENPTEVERGVPELASQLGVSLASVKGTGKNGAITLADVKKADDAARGKAAADAKAKAEAEAKAKADAARPKTSNPPVGGF
jgi:pyruvate/2-oxoglutarate dehydrogenase complex dihydrolipoamide acyltransferase (E2) component